MILIIRITTSYRAIELGLPVFWLGIIATGFAIIPVFSAVTLGRWIDRGNDARAIWIGNVLILVACTGFWLWSNSAIESARAFGLAGLRPHVLHGRAPDADGARRRAAQPRKRARLLHDRRRDRTGRRTADGGLARRLGGAAADRFPVRHQPRHRGRGPGGRVADQVRAQRGTGGKKRRPGSARRVAPQARPAARSSSPAS